MPHDLAPSASQSLALFARPPVTTAARLVRFIQLRLRQTSGRHRVGTHRHDGYELLVPQRGIYRCSINGVGWQARPGEVLVVRPGDVHADDSPGPLALAALQFSVEPAITWATDERRSRWGVRDCAGIITALNALGHDALGGEAADAHCRLLLLRLLREAGAAPVLTADEALRQRCNEWLVNHVAEPLDLTAWALHLGLGRRTFSTRCREWFGTSPARLLLTQRLAHARLLLGETDLPVKAIAHRCGFANPNHFTTAFRKQFGHSPRDLVSG